jgi:hypothetical protein
MRPHHLECLSDLPVASAAWPLFLDCIQSSAKDSLTFAAVPPCAPIGGLRGPRLMLGRLDWLQA